MVRASDERIKQVTIGAGILIALMLVVTGALTGWRLLPGLLGEWVGMMIGIVTTPFFMEASFAVLGLVIVISVNHWRQQKDGDEFVYLEQITGPDVPADLPDHAKWALYRDKPLDAEAPTLLAQAEGAFAIGDYPAAAEWIGAMSRDELRLPKTLRLRQALANKTGRTELARQLEDEIRRSETGPI